MTPPPHAITGRRPDPPEARTCEVCGETRLCRYCSACEAWLCEPCRRDVPARAVAGFLRLRQRIKAGTLWQEVFRR